jgi:hypothetical protein
MAVNAATTSGRLDKLKIGTATSTGVVEAEMASTIACPIVTVTIGDANDVFVPPGRDGILFALKLTAETWTAKSMSGLL